MNVQPSTSFEAVADGFAAGLTGTIGVRIIDNAGATTTARVTAGIAEYPAGSGIYQKTLTSPATAGQYSIVWDDTSSYATEDLTVTATTLGALTGNLYVTRDEVKTAFSITETDYADADVDRAVVAASRGIDRATKRFFYSQDGTRYYTPEHRASAVEIDDIYDLTTLEVDLSGTGTFTTWTENTDFLFQPVNNPEDNKPYERVKLRQQRQTYWPCYESGLKITGSFGWPEIPAEVRQFAVFFAGKLLYRTRHAPLGILTISGDIGAVAHLVRTDPDFAPLIGDLVKTRPFA
jgi:hypothetical protein